jgi:hypothetical protein
MVSETILVISMGAYSRPYNFLRFFIYAVLLYNSSVGGCSVGVCATHWCTVFVVTKNTFNHGICLVLFYRHSVKKILSDVFNCDDEV